MKKECVSSWLFYKDYTEMHGQQNIKFFHVLFQSMTSVLSSGDHTVAFAGEFKVW